MCEATQCLKVSIQLIEKPGGKSKQRYNGRLWKINWWYIPRTTTAITHTSYAQQYPVLKTAQEIVNDPMWISWANSLYTVNL